MWLGVVLLVLGECCSAPTTGVVPTAYFDPEWSRGIRMVDVLFHQNYPASVAEVDNDLEAIREQIDAAAAVGATVVQVHFADEFVYADWIDDTGFSLNLDTLELVSDWAHDQGLRVLVYVNGLEVMTPGVDPDEERQGFDADVPSMRRDHPEWLQHTPDGKGLWFTGITADWVDYIQGADWEDAWLCPRTGYRELFLDRVRRVVEAGADGVFVDVAFLPGLPELVPEHLDTPDAYGQVSACYNPACQQAFAAANPGLIAPGPDLHLDWSSETWRRWILFRYQTVAEYYEAIRSTVIEVRADGLVLAETSANDVPQLAVTFGNDNTAAPVGITPEFEPPAVEDDEGCETGPQRYADYLAMALYGRAINRSAGRAYVPLGFRLSPLDHEIQFGILAATAGAYFTFGAAIEDLSQSFRFLAEHAPALNGAEPAARVAVLYSAPTRDFVDRLTGSAYEPDPAGPHFAEYRAVTRAMANAHVPYEILLAERASLDELSRFTAIVAPEVQCLSGSAAATLAQVATHRTLVATGSIGSCGVLGESASYALGDDVIALSPVRDGGAAALLDALAGAATQVRLEGHGLGSDAPVLVHTARAASGALLVHLVQLAGIVAGDCHADPVSEPTLSLQIEMEGLTSPTVRWAAPGRPEQTLSAAVDSSTLVLELTDVPTYSLLVVE